MAAAAALDEVNTNKPTGLALGPAAALARLDVRSDRAARLRLALLDEALRRRVEPRLLAGQPRPHVGPPLHKAQQRILLMRPAPRARATRHEQQSAPQQGDHHHSSRRSLRRRASPAARARAPWGKAWGSAAGAHPSYVCAVDGSAEAQPFGKKTNCGIASSEMSKRCARSCGRARVPRHARASTVARSAALPVWCSPALCGNTHSAHDAAETGGGAPYSRASYHPQSAHRPRRSARGSRRHRGSWCTRALRRGRPPSRRASRRRRNRSAGGEDGAVAA
eukprot:2719155-Prymnesium_polylepis.1